MPLWSAVPSQHAARPQLGELLRAIRDRLRQAGIPDATLESESLICHALGIRREQLWTFDGPVLLRRKRLLETLVERRLRREPLPYITGSVDFFGRCFAVDPRVLIPRPETEHLVDMALEWTRTRTLSCEGPTRIADIGTGSGILAITLALELPQAEVHAVDISPAALKVARGNARRLDTSGRVRFHTGDLTGPLRGRFQVLVANLPYIRTRMLSRLEPELSSEPRSALDGGPDGLKLIRPLIRMLPQSMSTPGLALLEIDPPIARRALALANAPFIDGTASVEKDLAGLDRVLVIER